MQQLELQTATKITMPRDGSDTIKIVGTKEGVDSARHEIQIISDEQVSRWQGHCSLHVRDGRIFQLNFVHSLKELCSNFRNDSPLTLHYSRATIILFLMKALHWWGSGGGGGGWG